MSNRVYIMCEGQTEESFINRVLAPYFEPFQIYCIPIIYRTKTTTSRVYRGGIDTYGKIKHQTQMLCHQHPNELVTTFVDYYQLPGDTPGMNLPYTSLYDRIATIEKCVEDDINASNLVFHLAVHEFEALLFSDPDAFQLISEDDNVISQIHQIHDYYENPEFINNSVETAPSKRLLQLIPYYAKIRHGTMLSEYIGIEKMKDECPHFKRWIEKVRRTYE